MINTEEQLRKMREGAQRAAAERKAAGLKVTKDPLERAAENPTSLRLAINGKCWDCQGAGGDGRRVTKLRIKDCEIPDCPLYPVRPYQKMDADAAGLYKNA